MVASGADDVGFLAALIERIRAEYGLGRARVFIAGGSNGAQMTHAFVFHRPEVVAAAASGAGSLPLTVVERDPGDGGSANRFDHAGTFPVQWWRLDGAGHTVPSRTVLVGTNPLTGTQNRDVEFAEIAWSFFAARLP